MKYLIILSLILLTACSKEKLDSESIFSETVTKKENAFDKWLKANYVDTYNIRLYYRMEDIESDYQYTLAPADLQKSQRLAKIVKYAWLEAYDEVAGVTFTRTYVPRIIHMIGSLAYEGNGTVVRGTAEGGMKVTFYDVNNLTVDADVLNRNYFKTMHHEFTHILTQTKNYDRDFERITEGKYTSGDWYQIDDDDALQRGFITPYSSSYPEEDYAEMVANYVINTKQAWDDKLTRAGEEGAALINRKTVMMKQYMLDSWGIDMDRLRSVVQRRMREIVNGQVDIETVI